MDFHHPKRLKGVYERCFLCIYIYIYIQNIYIFMYTLDPEKFDREKYIYVRHFETCYVIIRTQIHHTLYIYAKIVMRRPNPATNGHF